MLRGVVLRQRMEGAHFIEGKAGGEKAVLPQAKGARFSSSQALPSISISFQPQVEASGFSGRISAPGAVEGRGGGEL